MDAHAARLDDVAQGLDQVAIDLEGDDARARLDERERERSEPRSNL